MTKEYPSQEYLKECFDYDKESGALTWRIRPRSHFKNEGAFKMWNKRYSGANAGIKQKRNDGKCYLYINLNKEKLYCHRIAWIYENGNIELGFEIDHINGDGSDNSIKNIRTVSAKDNKKNIRIRKDNTSGVTGVSFSRSLGKWKVEIYSNAGYVFVGYFSIFEDAVKARKAAEVQYGYHENHGTERPL